MAAPDKRFAITTRIIWLVIGIFFLTMVISQIVIYFNNPIRTEVATLYTTTETLNFKGVYVRDEKLVSYPYSGVIAYTHPDGSKIAKNSVIAEVYKNRNDVAIHEQIDDLTAQREILSDAQGFYGADSSQLESFSNQITEKHAQLMQHLYNGDYKSAASLKSDMLDLQSKREIVRGTERSYSAKIAELDSRISVLKNKLTGESYPISIGETGYFVSAVDGYEGELNTSTMYHIPAARIRDITADETERENPKNVIGKLISDYNWYMIAVLDTIKLGTVFEGAQVTLRIGASQQNVKADIISLRRQDDGSSIAIFKCDMFLADFIDSRVTQVKLLMEDFTGIRVPSGAIRTNEDGEVGVYVLDGIVVRFRKIKPMLTEESYSLLYDTSDDNGYVSLYDTIIVEGRDLHDGKIVG